MNITCCLILVLLPLTVMSLPTDIELSISPVDSYYDTNSNNLEDVKRTKRAGSFNFIGAISNHNVDVSHFDGWKLKKSILNTLFEAVKAITGGITAINGQLIKGSGYVISAGGKVVSASGDAVTNVGKKIALSAKLIEPHNTKPNFLKYASSASAASSGSHSSGSSSGHDSTGHGESYANYEIPTGHVSYGPPEHSAGEPLSQPSAPSAPAQHVDLAATYLPVAYDQGYHAPTSGHGDTNYHTPVSSYGHGTDGKVEQNKYTNGPSHTKSQSLSHAADALRDILNKLPIHHTTSSDDHLQNDVTAVEHKPETHDNNVPFEPYEIPPDPIPQFKPIKQLVTSYGVPIQSPPIVTTHTQTITTAFGAPLSDYQKPISLVDSSWKNTPIGPGFEPGLDIYHSMTLKLGNDHKHKQQYLPPPHPPQHTSSQYPNAHYYEMYGNELVKRQTNVQHLNNVQKMNVQRTNIQKIRKREPDFEIQKSVAYELKQPAPQKLFKVRRHIG
ncbi:uncharacterized protein LOC119069317 isoform X2 [Bradysia coprophila]|uniref:uncharacterized protein LOC119069317 isoform X2 n=1 Tax=Bradysia coprophila TaxID=38358 RepID=UPI00187DB496|nr:uncharacterized protein LOC119069317 isoform X2 [Bradysia coprophila]